ncbi:restriction endonuclease subunit S [Pectobacterium versatile]|uniref:restriction endonuclease subunit S n=1 Tax=Pectobacterium versatile TaxID=2488639 RepID=UPI0015DD7BA2|nr:restriction endonuclease subunit S [Pectobacterium versatile]MBA0184714.1 restriction endonuclease subunit S [Pectobacterium versatile]
MKLVSVSDLFEVKYGSNLELNKQTIDPEGVSFVSRTAKNNGVSARVCLVEGVPPLPAGSITVACGGSVMESFLQSEPFYSGRDIYYLTARLDMSSQEKIFYCACLRANKYRFNYGRQANRTLAEIKIPSLESVPEWVQHANISAADNISKCLLDEIIELDVSSFKPFRYDDIFEIDRGRGPRKKELNGRGKHPFVSASEFNNGVTSKTDHVPMHQAGVISVVRNGNSVANAFYQDKPFCSTEDVHIFTPKINMNKYVALFLCALIKKERYRYSYGRKWGIARMKESLIFLPVDDTGEPDWLLMERYIKTLPFSAAI